MYFIFCQTVKNTDGKKVYGSPIAYNQYMYGIETLEEAQSIYEKAKNKKILSVTPPIEAASMAEAKRSAYFKEMVKNHNDTKTPYKKMI
jgi:hypothetical protein